MEGVDLAAVLRDVERRGKERKKRRDDAYLYSFSPPANLAVPSVCVCVYPHYGVTNFL